MFGQSGLTIVAPVYEEKVEVLRSLLMQIGRDPAGNPILPLGGLASLHFASLTLLPMHGKQRLVIEANVDGTAKDFLKQLVETLPAGVDALFSLCPGYEQDQRLHYLKIHDVGPGAFYVGCPGRSVAQILAEQKLRASIEAFLTSNPSPSLRRNDVLSFVRSSPDLTFALQPYVRPWLVRFGWIIYIFVAAIVAAIVALGYFKLVPAVYFWGAGFVLVVSVLLLLYQESQDQPFPNDQFGPEVQQIVDAEDFGPNNHMVSVTQIKPGVFRAVLIRLVLFLTTNIVRFIANQGELSGIRSIHFARWVIVEHDTLIFFSNFGGSWDSYLNDFIDLAASGLTGVWSNSVGFPKTRLLILEGARQALAFKIYARNSMSPTLAWYQAYPSLSTANIDNNTRIREGLISTAAEGEARWIERI